MSDFQQNRKDAENYLKTQEQISEAIERQTRSLKDYTEAQKTIQKNAKKIKDIDKEIAKLEGQKGKEARAAAEELRKQRDYLVGLNKELVKGRTLAKAYWKEMVGEDYANVKRGLMTVRKSLMDTAKGYFDMDGAVRRVSVGLGLNTKRLNAFRGVASATQKDLVNLGGDTKTAAEIMGSFAEQTGRQTLLSGESIKQIKLLAERTGMAHTEMAGLVGQMDAFGLGSVNALENLTSMVQTNEKMGVNSGKVIKKFQQNLSLVNKLSFKGGVTGMMKMAAYSEKYKISMEGVASVAEKVFRPEGAIEAAATLQTLGGSLSQLGDPFQLMYKGRHAPEELMKSISKASAATAVFNKKTGEFELGALELDRMREAANALNMNMEDLVSAAKQTAKMNMFEGSLKMDKSSEAAQFLTSIAEMKDGKPVIFTGEYDEKGMKKYQNLSEVTKEQAEEMAKSAESNQKKAEMAQSTMERLTNLFNSFLASFYEPIQKLDDEVLSKLVKDVVQPLVEWGKGLAKWLYDNPTLTKLIAGLVVFGPTIAKIFAPLGWYLKGLQLGKGFNAATTSGKGGFLSRIISLFSKKKGGPADVISGQAGGVTNQTGPLTKSGKPDMRYKVNRVNTTPTPTQSPVGGQASAAGSQVGGFTKALGSAVQILAIGAALMMLAKAVEILAKAALIIKENNLGATMLGLAVGLGVFVTLMGVLGSTGIGEAAAIVLIGIGAGMLMMGGAVALAAYGISLLVDSFTNLFSVISGDELMKSGAGILMLAAGIGVLTMSLLSLSSASFMAIPGLLMLGGLTAMMVGTAKALENANFGTLVSDLNNLDTEKLNTLREIVKLSAKGKPIKIEFGEIEFDGQIDIKGEGGGKKSTDWINDPIFVRKLKSFIMEAMEKDKKGNR
jgi:hypothetical protein